jgi:hypothetical protein
MTRFAIITSLAFALLATSVQDAPAQVDLRVLRGQTNQQIQRSIQTQVQQALRPSLVVRGLVPGGVPGMAISGSGRWLVLVAGDGSIRTWTLSRGDERMRLDERTSSPNLVTTSNVGAAIAFLDSGNALRVSRMTDGALLARITLSATPLSIAVSQDGQAVAAGFADGTAAVWGVATGQRIMRTHAHDGGVSAVAFVGNRTELASGGADGRLRLWDLQTGRRQREFSGTPGDSVTGILPLSDGRIAVATISGAIALRSATRQVPDATLVSRGGAVRLFEDRDHLLVLQADGKVRSFALSDGRLITEASVGGAIQSAVFDPIERRLFIGGSEGHVRIWDMSRGETVGTLFSTRSGWLVVDRIGRFDGSESGVRDAVWASGSVELPMRGFGREFFEPSLLAKIGRDPASFLTAAGSPIDEGIQLPPDVSIVVDATGGEAVVRMSATNRGGGIGDMMLFHNGRRVAESARTALAEDNSSTRRSVTFKVPMIIGDNRFEGVATSNRGIESVPVGVVRRLDGQPRRGVLHILTIGINNYRNGVDPLVYAVPDARAIADRVASAAGRLYEKVEISSVLDTSATVRGIEDAFRRLRLSRPEDTVVIYMAGHGQTFDGHWHFIPADFDPRIAQARIAQTSVPATTLDNWLSAIPARRVLMMIDACKSGAALDPIADRSARRSMNRIADSLGLHVLVATQRDQLAPEFDRLGHGAFTYGVLQGLGGAFADSVADGVSALTLIRFVERQVPLIASEQLEKLINEEQTVGSTRSVESAERVKILRNSDVPLPTVFSRGEDFLLARGTRG